MRLELKEFVKATRSMHEQPGGVKRTRLMLHLRPYQSRKVFLLKATDGRTTLTSRVEHQGQLKIVEALLSDFVAQCTHASLPAPTPAGAAANTTSAGGQPTASSTTASPVKGAQGGNKSQNNTSSAAAGGSSSPNQYQQQKGGKPQQQQQGKGKKGRKH